jgi:GntR family transcriptional regulator
MLELIVDTTDPTPPYEQLRRQLAALITAGALPPGERLPPLRQLAGDLGVAVGTVARTYRELESADLITSRRGGGTRVADRPPPAAPAPAPGDSLRAAAEAYVRQARALGARATDIAAAVHTALDPESPLYPT